jgi:hypothetical protein
VRHDDEETQFWSLGDEIEPDASGQIGRGALEPDPGVDRDAGPTRRARPDADAEATSVLRPSSSLPDEAGVPRASGRNWLEPVPLDDEPRGRRRAPRVRDKRPAAGPRLLAPVAFLAAVVALFSIVIDSGVLSDEATPAGNGPRPSAAASPHKKPKVYVVKQGDTLSGIAVKNDTTVDVLLQLNPKMSATTVNPGQKVKLPQD